MNRVLVAVGVCILLGSLASQHGLPGLIKARAESRQLATEVAALRAENTALRARVGRLQDDPSAIETIARRDFGLARVDELVVTVTRSPSVAQP